MDTGHPRGRLDTSVSRGEQAGEVLPFEVQTRVPERDGLVGLTEDAAGTSAAP